MEAYLPGREGHLGALEGGERALIEGRIRRRQSWTAITEELGLANPRVSMRALRRAVRALVRRADPEIEESW